MATHLPNEAALLAQARLGDTDAFGTLANQYYRHIYRLAFKITGNREDAEDVTQDSVLKAYCNLEQFRANSRFYTWLVRITVNQALMKLRKKRSERETLWDDLNPPGGTAGETPVVREVEDSQPSPEERYAGMEMQEIFSRALRTLRPRLCTVFTLRNVADFSARETAQMLGLSVAAVKSRLLRARLKLQHQLTPLIEREFEGWSRPEGSYPSCRLAKKKRARRPSLSVDFRKKSAAFGT